MTVAMRRELCAVMEYKIIERAGSVLYNGGDVIDSWSAILNGSVELIHPDGHVEELCDRCRITLYNSFYITLVFRLDVKIFDKFQTTLEAEFCNFKILLNCQAYCAAVDEQADLAVFLPRRCAYTGLHFE